MWIPSDTEYAIGSRDISELPSLPPSSVGFSPHSASPWACFEEFPECNLGGVSVKDFLVRGVLAAEEPLLGGFLVGLLRPVSSKHLPSSPGTQSNRGGERKPWSNGRLARPDTPTSPRFLALSGLDGVADLERVADEDVRTVARPAGFPASPVALAPRLGP